MPPLGSAIEGNPKPSEYPPGLDSDFEDNECEWDLAVTHKRNEELRQRESVKEFFAQIRTIESLWNQETRDWFGLLPHIMGTEAIPLFENSADGVSEDYQLHPSYSWLTLGEEVNDPDEDFYRLGKAGLQMSHLFIPLGRLFVNAENGNRFNARCNSSRSRLTRWTGYEVFVSSDLALWIVFDEKSPASNARPWYPVSCGIMDSCNSEPFEPTFGMARLLPSLNKLEYATFKDVMASIKDAHWCVQMRISEVEKSEVKLSERYQVRTPSQDTALAIGKRKQMSRRGESAFVNKNRDKLREANPDLKFGKSSALQ